MRTLLVDLDGTIVDSHPGIVAGFRHVFAQLGVDHDPDDALGWVVGPPSRHSFGRILGDEARVEAAVDLYRTFYTAHGIFDARPYDGIAEALRELRHGADRLLLCTAKPLPFAERVIAHFGLTDLFAALYGAELGGRFDDKGDLITHMAEREGLYADRTIMIGDRDSDVRAAARHGIACIGVTWGYGGAAELAGAGAALLCDRPADLPAAVRTLLGAGPPEPDRLQVR